MPDCLPLNRKSIVYSCSIKSIIRNKLFKAEVFAFEPFYKSCIDEPD